MHVSGENERLSSNGAGISGHDWHAATCDKGSGFHARERPISLTTNFHTFQQLTWPFRRVKIKKISGSKESINTLIAATLTDGREPPRGPQTRLSRSATAVCRSGPRRGDLTGKVADSGVLR